MKNDKKLWKIAAILLLFLLVTASAAQAITKVKTKKDISIEDEKPFIITNYDDEVYQWVDNFDNGQKIDMSLSEDYVVENGKIGMDETYTWWTDPSWTRAKIITLDSSISDNNVAIKLIVEHDSDMRSDYGDVRFRYNAGWLEYWIEEKNPDPQYAIIWVKIPSISQGTSDMYMFYGKPSAQDEGSYWAVFDENSWQSEHVHDERVTNHWYKEGAWDPDVCYGDGKFLVTWEEGTGFVPLQGTIFQQQIRGCYYDTAGDPISNRFDIVDEQDETPPYRYESPASAYGKSGKFFVAYEAYINPITNNYIDRDIEGAIVSTAADGASTRFTICSESNIQADPRVAYDPNHDRFFVVWEDGRSGTSNYDIYGRMYDSNGNSVGGEFSLVQGTPNQALTQCEPWIAFDTANNHYMVVWEESTDQPDTGPFEIWGQLFDWQGGGLGSPQRISQLSSGSTDYNFPSVAFCELTEKFLVTWNQADISSDDFSGYVYGRFIDENGNLDPSVITIATGQYCRTDVVPYLSTSFFVSYDNWAGSTGDIWGKMVNNDGSVNQYTIQLSDGDSDPCDWVNIGSSGDKIFVAWEDIRLVYQDPFDGMSDIYSNVWSLNTPSGSDVSCDFGDEKSLVLNAHVVSVPIAPVNWQEWCEFDAVKTGNVDFDILDADNPDQVLKSDVSPGYNLESINKASIRLRARFSRNDPSVAPTLDMWSVTYFGKDELPPETWVSDVVGLEGLNGYYKSETVKIYLDAKDYPEDTGSGVYKTWYRVNEGSGWGPTLEYNEFIELAAPGDTKQGSWEVNFWSEDNKGNIEDKTETPNTRSIKIDWGIPFVTITEPVNEQRLTMGFWIRATAEDNVGLEKVEFDISPFGDRPGLPFEDKEPPYEWYCDVEQIKKAKSMATMHSGDIAPLSSGVNLWIRTFAYDYAGHSYYSEIVVYITDWDAVSHSIDIVRIDHRSLLNTLKLGFALDSTLNVEVPVSNHVDSVKFVATNIFNGKNAVLWDNDLSNGCTASFDIPTGFYKITTYAYNDDKQMAADVIARVLYVAR